MTASLPEVWDAQLFYNKRLKASRDAMDSEEWAKIYLLGLTAEISEVLREINWKVHRSEMGEDIELTSLALELADLQKYVLCLFQNFGFSLNEMLDWVQYKSEVMEYRQQQEFGPPIIDSNVLVLDLDGVVADWRKGFLEWVHLRAGSGMSDPERSLSLDIDMGWSYAAYSRWKKDFERDGGFASLPPFEDTVKLVREWRAGTSDARLVVTTARTTTIPRVWYDTYSWLKAQGILPDRLYFTADGRIAITLDLAAVNKDVVLVDDNPDIHLRTSHNQLRVLVPTRGYNWAIVPDPPLIRKAVSLYEMWKSYPEIMPGGKPCGQKS